MKMDYFVLGTNDLPKAIEFYNGLFEGQTLQTMPTDRMHYWAGEGFAFAVALPFDEKEATNGNGTMIGFGLNSAEEVQAFHQKAIDLGGASDGDPCQKGPRFSGYVRDLDNNKICFHF